MRRNFYLVLALVLSGCRFSDRDTAKQSVVKIGQVIDRTGSIATPSWGESIRLATITMNEALKRAGHPNVKFEIVEANSGNSPDMARAGALQVVRQEGAKAVITDSSQDDIAANQLAYDGDPQHELNVPIVCMACTSPSINSPEATDPDPVKQAALRNLKKWNFRTNISDAYQARIVAPVVLARGDSNGNGRYKVTLYASNDPYGHGFSDAVKSALLAQRPNADVEQIYHDVKADPAEYNWAADVARVLDRKNESTGKVDGQPDVVVEISFPKFMVGFMKAWNAAGAKTPIVHTHNFRSARLIETLGATIDGHEGTSQAVLGDGPSAQAFTDDLVAQTGQPPAFRDAAAYDAAMTLMLATLHAANSAHLADPAQVSGASIRDSMRAINDRSGESVTAGVAGIAKAIQLMDAGKPIDYAGASGPCDFDANGDVLTHLARFRVQGGRFVDVEKFDCTRAHSCPSLTALGAR